MASGCANGVDERPPAPAPAVATSPAAPESRPARAPAPTPEASRAAPRPASPQVPPEVINEAKAHLNRGLAAFQRGAYDEAEGHLKLAMTKYPFLALANLTLGKVFLLRGAAGKDYTLIDSARLMFEMARALDPSLRESLVLLDLFRPPGGE